MEPILQSASQAMQKSVDYTAQEFAGVRTGKASPTLVENIAINVASYGSSMPLKQLAQIATPEARLITVSPFDPSTLNDIQKGINESKLGITPSIDGKLIRLPVPEPTEERRRELVKMVKDMAEQGRVRVRGARKDAMDTIKKSAEHTEDQKKDLEGEVQKLTDKHVELINQSFTAKEEEIMKV